jgi:hypothetical protein
MPPAYHANSSCHARVSRPAAGAGNGGQTSELPTPFGQGCVAHFGDVAGHSISRSAVARCPTFPRRGSVPAGRRYPRYGVPALAGLMDAFTCTRSGPTRSTWRSPHRLKPGLRAAVDRAAHRTPKSGLRLSAPPRQFPSQPGGSSTADGLGRRQIDASAATTGRIQVNTSRPLRRGVSQGSGLTFDTAFAARRLRLRRRH